MFARRDTARSASAPFVARRQHAREVARRLLNRASGMIGGAGKLVLLCGDSANSHRRRRPIR
jgi:hypothetical protein